jgi:ribosomal protein S18 acetylase RimI-like enzyme
MPDLRIRPLLPSDQDTIWDLLHIALWDPPPAPLRPREVLQRPEVRIYAEEWGKRDGDIGICGQLAENPAIIGACWMRRVTGGRGLAFIDETTPQLGIALFPAYQHRGFGEQLMRAALAAASQRYRQVSLSVHPENPAARLYRHCGFVEMDVRNGFLIMVNTFA